MPLQRYLSLRYDGIVFSTQYRFSSSQLVSELGTHPFTYYDGKEIRKSICSSQESHVLCGGSSLMSWFRFILRRGYGQSRLPLRACVGWYTDGGVYLLFINLTLWEKLTVPFTEMAGLGEENYLQESTVSDVCLPPPLTSLLLRIKLTIDTDRSSTKLTCQAICYGRFQIGTLGGR